MFWLWILLLPTNLIFLSGCNQEVHPKASFPNDYSATLKFTEKRIDQTMRRFHLPGFAISLIDDQEIIYQKAFGLADIEKDIKASTQTIFKIWSVAKAFTAIEIFHEVEEGMVDLDSPIKNYLPEFSIQSRFIDEKSITVRHLLAHRSGLPRNECVSVPSSGNDTQALERFEKSTTDCYMAYPIAYRYKYANLGYDILGRIIEQNRGESFPSYMDKNILNALGMDNSSFYSKDIFNQENIAKGYEFYKGKYYPMEQSDINSVPSGNLYSTIEDLSVFLKAVFNNSIFQNQETLSLMMVDHYSKKTDPETMGLGWKTSKILGTELLAWHDGGPSEGIGALIAYLPQRKVGLAIIANGTNFSGSASVPLAVEILNHMLKTKIDFEYKRPEKSKRIKLSIQLLERFAGKYSAFGQILEVKNKSNKLKIKIGGIGLDLIPVGETEFRITHWMDRIGLTKIIKPPIDFDKIKIEFHQGNMSDSCNMVINFDNISFEICPRYPEYTIIPDSWRALEGEYQMTERLSGDKAGDLTGSKFSIDLKDNVLIMSQPFGPILPLDNHFIVITSGPFAGETIEYLRESGNIIHQNAVFVPVKKG